MKDKFIHAHMKAAEVYADLSSATRLKVGCVIVKDNTVIGIGYNGMPSGWDNQCEDVFFIEHKDIDNHYRVESLIQLGYVETAQGWTKTKSRPEVLHAETNAIAKVSQSTNSSKDAALFVTHAPCLDCAKLIHQSGITNVYYKNKYRSDDGINFLNKCGVNVHHV